jgi:hypothetical protein
LEWREREAIERRNNLLSDRIYYRLPRSDLISDMSAVKDREGVERVGEGGREGGIHSDF